jgi:hypothetical protein
LGLWILLNQNLRSPKKSYAPIYCFDLSLVLTIAIKALRSGRAFFMADINVPETKPASSTAATVCRSFLHSKNNFHILKPSAGSFRKCCYKLK